MSIFDEGEIKKKMTNLVKFKYSELKSKIEGGGIQ